MKFKSISAQKTFINSLAILLLAGVSTSLLADNKEALKDAIGKNTNVAEVKASEAKPAYADADFKKLDSNSDEKISLKEAVKDKALSAQFDATDINHDGVVSVDEYAYFKNPSIKSMESIPATNPTN